MRTCHSVLLLFLVCCAPIAFAMEAEPVKPPLYLPEDTPLPTCERPLLRREDVAITLPELGIVQAGAMLRRSSLAGLWKFSGLETAQTPFPSQTPQEELWRAAADTDDSGWEDIKVPTNWWTTERWAYAKVFRHVDRTEEKGGEVHRRAVELLGLDGIDLIEGAG